LDFLFENIPSGNTAHDVAKLQNSAASSHPSCGGEKVQQTIQIQTSFPQCQEICSNKFCPNMCIPFQNQKNLF
jgi:hypothetical protein